MTGYSTIAGIMKALGHPVRLQILTVLSQGEACVCHLETVLGQRQAAISQHLIRLREAGLVTDRREDLFVYYSLADEAITRLLEAAVAAASAVGGGELALPVLPVGTEAGCCCPKCEAKRK